MKNLILICLCVAGAVLLFCLRDTTILCTTTVTEDVIARAPAPNHSAFKDRSLSDEKIPSKEERLRMSRAKRIELLEKLGCVPEDADISDYILAEKTSWWGKRLNPDEFWKGRVLWYDWAIERDANRYGRAYPPMPYEDPSIADRSDVDKMGDGISLENYDPSYVFSVRENVFWDKFRKTHPNPPDQIQLWLEENASTHVFFLHLIEHDPDMTAKVGLTRKNLSFSVALRDTKTFFFPPESVSEEAYHWTYVMKKRKEYKEWKNSSLADDEALFEIFFRKVYVDKKLITEPLTEADMKAANAWKVAYLRRLRTDKWDESYINAYLQAWDLKETDVFGDGNAVLAR